MVLLLATVPAHRDPNAEHDVARHVREKHEQEPPDLVRELEVLLLAQIRDDQVERHGEHQKQNRRGALPGNWELVGNWELEIASWDERDADTR